MIQEKAETKPEISLVVCVLNEEENIHPFLDACIPVMESCTTSFEIIFINDGSTDSTLNKILDYPDTSSIKIISFSRNFGKEIALTAGLDSSKGLAVIPIDVDLQLPVETIPEFIKKWKEGYKNVIGVRENRDYETWLKKKISNTFYKIIDRMSKVEITPNAGDFRLMDRKVVDEVIKLRETNRFMKGVFSFPGFSRAYVSFKVQPRISGSSKWSLWKLWNFSLDGIFGFSTFPLRAWSYIGVLIFIFSLFYLIYVILKALFFGIETAGFTTTVVLILFFGSIQLISIGVLGEYIGRIFEQSQNRPLYVIDEVIDLTKQ